MASEIERALDEILTGVEALLSTRGAPDPSAPSASSATGPVMPLEVVLSVGAHDQAGLMGLLATMESDPGQAARGLARRWLLRLIGARAVSLGSLAPHHADFTVSPLLKQGLQKWAAVGAQLRRCEADQMLWSGPAPLPSDLGRLALLARPGTAQSEEGLWRLPRFPERLPIRQVRADTFGLQRVFRADARAAIYDQDDPKTEPATVFWLEQGRELPEWLCGFTVSAGQWLALIDPKKV
jgi:hypothetical protein